MSSVHLCNRPPSVATDLLGEQSEGFLRGHRNSKGAHPAEREARLSHVRVVPDLCSCRGHAAASWRPLSRRDRQQENRRLLVR